MVRHLIGVILTFSLPFPGQMVEQYKKIFEYSISRCHASAVFSTVPQNCALSASLEKIESWIYIKMTIVSKIRVPKKRDILHQKPKNFGYRGHATQNAFPNAMIFLGERDESCAP